MNLPYQNLCGKIPEGRHSQSVRILELNLQQRVTQSLHTAAGQKNMRSWPQYWGSHSKALQNTSNFSLTISAVLSAARPLYPGPVHPPSCLCSHSVPYCSGFAWPRGQRVWQSLSGRCSSDKARRRHPPLAPWCEVGAVWSPGPAQRTGSCPAMTPCGCPDTAALRGRHGRRRRWNDGNVITSILEYMFKVLYLSVVGSTADGGSLLWCQGCPAPAAPTGQSAALWVCRSGKKLTLIRTISSQHSRH